VPTPRLPDAFKPTLFYNFFLILGLIVCIVFPGVIPDLPQILGRQYTRLCRKPIALPSFCSVDTMPNREQFQQAGPM
jgi:hypothetical protein